jgi:hypothetical protein
VEGGNKPKIQISNVQNVWDLVLRIQDLKRSHVGIWYLFRMKKGAALRCPLIFSSATEHKSYVTVTEVTR